MTEVVAPTYFDVHAAALGFGFFACFLFAGLVVGVFLAAYNAWRA
jgi:hypothetical protein